MALLYINVLTILFGFQIFFGNALKLRMNSVRFVICSDGHNHLMSVVVMNVIGDLWIDSYSSDLTELWPGSLI